MSGVSLTEALAIAARYTDVKKANHGLHVVVLRDGCIRATDHMSGCEIPCEAVEGLDLAVDCAALRRMVAAIGDGVKLAKISGRKLEVTGSGSKFKLQAIKASKEPMFPEIPEGRAWSDVSKSHLTALSKVASMADLKSEKAAFTGIRLTKDWCASTDGQAMSYAWITGLVDEPFTCPPGMFSDLAEDATICVDGRRLYLRGVTSRQIRWSTGIDAPFPDDGLVQMLTQARGRNRWTATIQLADLALLCKQAGVVNGNTAQTFKLTMRDDALTLRGQYEKAEFNGSTPVGDLTLSGGEVDDIVGVDTKLLDTIASIVAVAGGTTYIAIAGQMNPIMIWNHDADVIVETLLMPRRLGV